MTLAPSTRFRHGRRVQRVSRIDLLMMLAVLVVTVIGLKVVGLVLIVALLIIPPVAARFWTDQVGRMIWISGCIGGVSGYVGAAVSASAPNLPTGPIIVLAAAAAVFVASLLFAPARGLAAAVWATPLQGARPSSPGSAGHRPAGTDPGGYTLRLLQREPDPRRRRPDGCRPCCGGQGLPR
jgi:manganese/zinc/iron transport system permease protein